MEQFQQQQHDHQKQEQVRAAAQSLINDAYIQHEKAAHHRRSKDHKEAAKTLPKTKDKSHDHKSSQSVPTSVPGSASASGVLSPTSVRTEPVHDSKHSRRSSRPKTALDRLLSEGSLTGLPQYSGGITTMPSTAWQSSAPSASQRPPGDTTPSQSRLASLTPQEKQLLLQAIREEIRSMKHSSKR